MSHNELSLLLKSSSHLAKCSTSKWSGVLRRYRRADKVITSKAALTTLLWAFVIITGADFLSLSISFYIPVDYLPLSYAAYCLTFPLYAVAGFLGDVKLGRYLAITCSVYSMLGLIAISCATLAVILPAVLFSTGENVSFLTPILSVPVRIVRVMFFANAIQFGTDQLHEYPVDHQSLFIHWYYFVYTLGHLLAAISSSFYYFQSSQDVLPAAIGTSVLAILSAASTVALLVSVLIIRYRKSWFLVDNARYNPYKLVFRVTKFAWLHKVPVQRSAFTYCEDDIPTGLDLGKQKYGGPFTSEQVEDVKAFYGILKVLIALGPVYFITVSVNSGGINESLDSPFMRKPIEDTALHVFFDMLPSLLVLAFIPIYLCIVRPLGFQYIPGMLKRMGIGAAVTLVALILTLTVSMITEVDGSVCNVTSLEKNSSNADSLGLYLGVPYLVITSFLSAFTLMLTNITRFEFICAQSPHFMKGFLVGLSLAMAGIFEGLAYLTSYLVSVLHIPSYGSDITYYLVNLIVGVASFLGFIYIGKTYKYRRRDDICHVYRYVEDYYSKTLQHRNITNTQIQS